MSAPAPEVKNSLTMYHLANAIEDSVVGDSYAVLPSLFEAIAELDALNAGPEKPVPYELKVFRVTSEEVA